MPATEQTAYRSAGSTGPDGLPGPEFPAEQLRSVPGQRVDMEVYGGKVRGVVVRPGRGSAVIDVDSSSDVRRLRLGVRVKAAFATPEGAAQVEATLGQAHDGIVLRFIGDVRLVNRRRHPRATIAVPAHLAWRALGRLAMHTADAVTVNLSAGGAMLQLGTAAAPPIPTGTLALLALDLPQHPLDLPARVLEQTGSRLRVQFSGPCDTDVATVSQLITHHLLRAPHGS